MRGRRPSSCKRWKNSTPTCASCAAARRRRHFDHGPDDAGGVAGTSITCGSHRQTSGRSHRCLDRSHQFAFWRRRLTRITQGSDRGENTWQTNRPVQAPGIGRATAARNHSRTSIAPIFRRPLLVEDDGLIFDGQSLRIEFAVTRIDEVKPNMPITGRRYPACRWCCRRPLRPI